MYRYQRPASPWPRLLLIGSAVLALLLAAFIFSLPRVVGFTPQGSNISARAPVTLTFSSEMNESSVEQQLHFEPVIVGAFSWQGRTLTFAPAAEWPAGPVKITLSAGAADRNGLPILFETSWGFTIGAPSIAFLMKTGDIANVWSQSITGEGDPTQITDERFGIDRFAVSPDGTRFAYAALRTDGGADLKTLTRDGGAAAELLACPSDRCTAPAFSKDGSRLAFERHPLTTLEQSTIEVIDLQTGQRTVIDSDPAHLSQTPTFARDGRLAYLNLYEQVIVIYDFATGNSQRLPNNSGEMGAWSPDGQFLVFPQITSEPPPTPEPGTEIPALQLDTFFSHLMRVIVNTGASENISGASAVEDAAPVYSPFGEWIVFGRKDIQQDKWTPGKQLWLMRADGSEPRPLTNDPLFNHSHFVWNPDGTSIVYVRFDVTDPASITEIWSVSANGANAQKLVTGGYLPQWLP
jgi:Tol biopolymer transport system component